MSESDGQYTNQPSVESQALSEEWSESEAEQDFDDYYGGDDMDVMGGDSGGGVRDASFQEDPEYFEFSCLTSEETWNFLDSQARDVAREIKVDVSSSRGLLQSLHWETKEVVRRYKENCHSMMVEAQLRPDSIDHRGKFHDYCPVCLTPTSECQMYGMVCGHKFCSLCWAEYLTNKICTGVAASIECMECSVRVSLEMVHTLLQSSAEIHAKFLKFALTEYVQSHSLLRWCTGPECSIVFQVREPWAKLVTCSVCSSSCCFKCGEEYHCPTGCETIRMWLIKSHDDSETAHYIQANTKDCPNCHTAIEKNGGCNHMCCSQCHHNFCWMCLGSWRSHTGYFSCSKYDEKNAKDASEINSARAALDKYLFYYQRWANHDQSLKLEEVTKGNLLNRMEEKVSSGAGTWIDWQYLLDAVALLRKCRYTLKYTYPFAYYLEGDRKPLFEYQQAQLEVEIENLSWKVERAETTDVADIRQQMSITEIKRLTLLRDFVDVS